MTAPAHLLMVDDEPDFLASAAALLEADGFVVTPVADPRSAVAAVCDGLTPDLVLLDFRMPGLNGAQALAQMRDCGLKAPAVLVSAMARLVEEAASAGFDAALPKPFEIESMLQVVRRMLAPRPAAGAGVP